MLKSIIALAKRVLLFIAKPRIRTRYFVLGLSLFLIALTFAAWLYVDQYTVSLLEPKGIIAEKELKLMQTAGILSLIIILPVFALTGFIVWKYRASNKKAKHSPDWDSNRWLETIWWLIPCAIIVVLAVITWRSSHELDPYRKLESDKKPLTIKVIALQWKWLFIYPEQDIATVNYLQIPEKTPINFDITADAPMNSFWIPQLGGQVYAMAGMNTKLHLMANGRGTYDGSSANISGEGFSRMRFNVQSVSEDGFDLWVTSVKHAPKKELNLTSYNELAKPSEHNPKSYYTTEQDGLYNTILMKYMGHGH